MTNREFEIHLLAIENREPVFRIRDMFNQVDLKYGNVISENQKFKYVARILERKRFKQLAYDDLTPIFFETAKSRGVTLARTDSLDEETIKNLGSFLTYQMRNEELFQTMSEAIKGLRFLSKEGLQSKLNVLSVKHCFNMEILIFNI